MYNTDYSSTKKLLWVHFTICLLIPNSFRIEAIYAEIQFILTFFCRKVCSKICKQTNNRFMEYVSHSSENNQLILSIWNSTISNFTKQKVNKILTHREETISGALQYGLYRQFFFQVSENKIVINANILFLFN